MNADKSPYDNRIARAAELAERYPAARELLIFYRELAHLQRTIHEEVRGGGETDVRALSGHFPAVLELVRRAGPEPLAAFGEEHLGAPGAQQELLTAVWEGEGSEDPAAQFFARVILQPFAEALALRGQAVAEESTPLCPFCGGRPVAGVLRGEGDGAKRWMLCSVCSTEWAFLRVHCPYCGEQEKDLLPVYIAPEFDQVRVEACDSCKTYIKSVDLTRDGRAVPVVDELAAIALDIWADEHGYTKVEANLLGI